MRVRPEAAWSVAGVVAAIGGYTGKVVYEQRQHYRHLQDKDNKWKLKFGPGSADELLQDSLKTGDILLFSRKWYYYHLPEAIYIKAYQTLFNTEYNDAHFLDLQEIFYNDFKVNNKKFEFKTDGHWSPYGHSIASEALIKKTTEILNITE